MDYTNEEIDEIKRCGESFLYFVANYGEGITLSDESRAVMNNLGSNRFIVWDVVDPHQRDLIMEHYVLWYALRNIDKNVLVVKTDHRKAESMLMNICKLYFRLPKFLTDNAKGTFKNLPTQTMIEFINGCRIFITPYGEPGLGFNVHLVCFDEAAHVKNSDMHKMYSCLYPAISHNNNSQMIMSSTANEKHFDKLLRDAKNDKNNFKPIKF